MLAVLEPVRANLQQRGKSASWNLQLDKLSFKRGGDDDAKLQSLDSVRKSYNDSRTQAHLQDACNRHRVFHDLLRARYGVDYRETTLVNCTRLLLHLGRASVLENVGLASERSTGLPVIPGSGIKGILSTWACWESNLLPDGALPESIAKGNQNRAQFSSLAERIFGSNAESGSASAGEVVFLGGFPVDPPKLVLDILTPHAGDNPLPNRFLALDPGTLWVFPLLARSRHGDAGKLLQQVTDWLYAALTQVGLGAKTAAGYGRFRQLTTSEIAKLEATRQAATAANAAKRKAAEDERARLAEAEALVKRKAEQLALLSPEERAYVEYVEKVTDWTAATREIAGKPESEKQQILRFFRSADGSALLKTWTNDKGKKRIQNLKDAGL